MRPTVKGIGKWHVDGGGDMMLTRDTPWNNFINVELELLISRHGQHDLFYCDTFWRRCLVLLHECNISNLSLSRLFSSRCPYPIYCAFFLCLIHDCDKINVGPVLWTVKQSVPFYPIPSLFLGQFLLFFFFFYRSQGISRSKRLKRCRRVKNFGEDAIVCNDEEEKGWDKGGRKSGSFVQDLPWRGLGII